MAKIKKAKIGKMKLQPAQGGSIAMVTSTRDDIDSYTRAQWRLQALQIARGAADGSITPSDLCAHAQRLMDFIEAPKVIKAT